ncbi:MAG: UDP-2,3-diacylglucosamine diphosphatase [Bacteroidota bacterium]|nr:UDP-2,3-diacylglucosamine diphosphatase [Bacteroidota bacterium]
MGKIYFASDFHLGAQGLLSSQERERVVVRWLDKVSGDAEAIYLVGDLFDFWFEYKKVVPKGYVRLLGKMAELVDKGIMIYVFTGNHDLWMADYLTEEMNIPVFRKSIQVDIKGKKFMIGHGDGLGPGDLGYKRMKRVFTSPFAWFLFRWIHPDIGIRIANYFSKKSRDAQLEIQRYLGDKNEWLIQYVEKKNLEEERDYYIFGHRHLPIDYRLQNGKSRYINLGDWVRFQTYGVFDGNQMELKYFEIENGKIYP